jgi:hypothetical protein
VRERERGFTRDDCYYDLVDFVFSVVCGGRVLWNFIWNEAFNHNNVGRMKMGGFYEKIRSAPAVLSVTLEIKPFKSKHASLA